MIEAIYSRVIRRSPEGMRNLRPEARPHVPGNGLKLVSASALQSSGDQVVNASTVLPWLFHALGVPPALIGALVPIRESLSMLPQAFLTPLVVRMRYRKWVFAAGALVQAGAVVGMALTAALGSGLSAGLVILAALAVFSLGRCLTSISSKDLQGRTVPKGERGQINGIATFASGLVAITVGVGIRIIGGGDISAGQIAWLLAGGAVLWGLAAVVIATLREPGEEPATRDEQRLGVISLLREDKEFRRFVSVRSFLLVSALSPPFIVSLSASTGGSALGGLGAFVVASGIASLIGGPIFGRVADRSSRTLMSVGAAAASGVIIVLVVVASLPGFDGGTIVGTAVFTLAYLALRLLHTGVRVGRKTYVVDMAEGDLRTRYVAVSNSAMGVILLVVGGISSLLALLGVAWALLFLAALGILGTIAGRSLPDVSRAA